MCFPDYIAALIFTIIKKASNHSLLLCASYITIRVVPLELRCAWSQSMYILTLHGQEVMVVAIARQVQVAGNKVRPKGKGKANKSTSPRTEKEISALP